MELDQCHASNATISKLHATKELPVKKINCNGKLFRFETEYRRKTEKRDENTNRPLKGILEGSKYTRRENGELIL